MSRCTHESPPTGWTSYPFWAIATEKVITGQESEGLLSVYLDRGVIPYSEGGGLVHKPAESLEKYQLVEAGDFVMNNQQAWRGSVGVSKHRGIVSPAYLVFSLDKSKLLPEYAAYMLRDKSYVEKYMLSSLSVGDIQRQIKWNHLRKIILQLPPQDEQRNLVQYLDNKISRIDALIDKKTRLIELLKAKRQACIAKAVTKGLIRDVSLKKSGVKWLGDIPVHWEIKRAKYLFQLNKREPIDTDGIVTAFRDGQVTLRANRRTDGFTNSFKEVGYQRVLKGDLVIHAMDAFAGAVGVSDSDGKCTPVYSCCTPIGNINATFYARMIRNMALSGYIESLAKGIRERSTDFRWREFAEQKLPIPPLDEQLAINSFIDRQLTRIEPLIEKTQLSIELLREHRSALITAAVTGKINIRISK